MNLLLNLIYFYQVSYFLQLVQGLQFVKLFLQTLHALLQTIYQIIHLAIYTIQTEEFQMEQSSCVGESLPLILTNAINLTKIQIRGYYSLPYLNHELFIMLSLLLQWVPFGQKVVDGADIGKRLVQFSLMALSFQDQLCQQYGLIHVLLNYMMEES